MNLFVLKPKCLYGSASLNLIFLDVDYAPNLGYNKPDFLLPIFILPTPSYGLPNYFSGCLIGSSMRISLYRIDK